MEKLKIRGLKAYDFDKNPKKGMPYLKKKDQRQLKLPRYKFEPIK